MMHSCPVISVANQTTIQIEKLNNMSRDNESDCDEILAEDKSISLQFDGIR